MRNKLKILLREGLITEANPMKIAKKFGISNDIITFLIDRYGKKYSIIALKIFVINNNMTPDGDMYFPNGGEIPLGSAFNPETLKSYKTEMVRLATFNQTIMDQLEDHINANLDDIMNFIKTENKPPIDLKTLTTDDLSWYMRKYKNISDWANNHNVETPNLTTMTWHGAIMASEGWHEDLKSGDAIGNEKGKIIHTFEDGYYWFDNGPGPCEDEGDAAGHCGIPARPEMHMISLRKKRKPAVTLDWDPETKEIVQFEGNASTKPKAKYHPYILWFISDPNRVKILSPELSHSPSINFNVSDLTDGEMYDLMNKNPTIFGEDWVINNVETVEMFFKILSINPSIINNAHEGINEIFDNIYRGGTDDFKMLSKPEMLGGLHADIISQMIVMSAKSLKNINQLIQIPNFNNILNLEMVSSIMTYTDEPEKALMLLGDKAKGIFINNFNDIHGYSHDDKREEILRDLYSKLRD